MHEAYIVYPPAKLSVKIESMAAYDNHVILGTSSGQLLMYSVSQNEITNKIELQLLKFNKSFSKKPITQIEVIPEENLLFILSDGIVNVCDISNLNFVLIHSAAKTKGTNLFCLDAKPSTSLTGKKVVLLRICVAIKRKLQFYYWKQDQFLELKIDIELNEVPKALSWYQDVMCVGFKTGYVIYDLSKEPKKYDIFEPMYSLVIDPCICLMKDDVFGVTKDQYLITVYPESIIPKDDKADAETQVKQQLEKMSQRSTGDKKVRPFEWSEPVTALVWDEPYIIGRVPAGLEIRSLDMNGINKDSLVQTIPELNKVQFIVRSAKGALFAASFQDLWYIQQEEIPKQRKSLLQQKKFQLAIELTEVSDESEDEKKENIHQIETLYAFELFKNKQFSEAMEFFTKVKADPCQVIRLFPDLLPQDQQKAAQPPLDQPLISLEEGDLENGLLALIDYLVEVRRYLLQDSKKCGKKSPLLPIIDTTLLKCYLQTNVSFVAPLIRLNNCILEESEKLLLKHKMFSELILLYQTKGHHKRALESLRTEADKSGSTLYGHERTIQYLQHLGKEYKELIFEFSDWVLKKHPEDGLKIFTDDFGEVENLPRAEVLDFLLRNHRPLVVPYLEHIINVWNENKAIFHNILIQQYRERIQNLRAELKKRDEPGDSVMLGKIQTKLMEFLKNSTKYAPEVVLKDFPCDALFEERAIILGRLKKHEKVLAIYIQILGDVKKASDYCEEVYSEEKDIFAMLIRIMLITPSAPPYTGVELHPNCLKPDIDLVLDLLNKYAKKLDPVKVLPYLPDDIPLNKLKQFLSGALKTQLEARSNNQVLKGLLDAEDLQMQEQQMHYEMKHVTITDFTVCPVCKKRFTNQSAFVRYPDGNIVHFSCQDRR